MSRTTRAQVPVLLRLRWQMLRTARQRIGAGVLLSLLPALLLLAVAAALVAPRQYADEAATLAPSAYLAFLVVSIIAPISAGGGNDLYPPTQLLAYPIQPRTTFHASLALMPLNIAWLANVIGLMGLTVYIVPPGRYTMLALVTGAGFAAMATLIGAAVAWLFVGLRQSTLGRRSVNVVTIVVVAATAVVVATDRLTDLLDQVVPTRRVVFGLLIAARGNSDLWLLRMAVVTAIALTAYCLGRRWCAWALRRPATTRNVEDGNQRHRLRPSHAPLRQIVALDRASVWRSTSLRRGLLVLAAAPGALAAAISLQWAEIILLPGLAAAGAGLLFGVNAFCLHGTGVVWLASQPDALRHALASKVIVTAETCGIAVLTTVVAASVRARTDPGVSEIATLIVWCPLIVAVVVAICIHLSVTRPHRADLSGHRDVPAPPGAMALYSVRLALVTTSLSLVVSVLARVASSRFLWGAALLLAGFCALSLAVTAAKWRNRAVQATVVTTVAAG